MPSTGRSAAVRSWAERLRIIRYLRAFWLTPLFGSQPHDHISQEQTRSIESNDDLDAQILRAVRLAKEIWVRQRRAGELPDRTWFAAALEKTVREIADTSSALSAGLAVAYPDWTVCCLPQAAHPNLPAVVANGLADIEDRYARCLGICGDREGQTASMRRNAALIDSLTDTDEEMRALNGLCEALLEANVRPELETGVGPSSRVWASLADGWRSLRKFHEIDGTWRVPLVPNNDVADRVGEFARCIADALRFSPPGLLRFSAKPRRVSCEYSAAVAAPKAAVWLLRRLTAWERQEIVSDRTKREIGEASAILLSSLKDWLLRSDPNTNTNDIDPTYNLTRWVKHIRRARMVGAPDWHRQWFATQLATAVSAGQSVSGLKDPDTTSVALYIGLCTTAYLCGWPPPEGGDESWYSAEADRLIPRLHKDQHVHFTNHIQDIRTPRSDWLSPLYLTDWLRGGSAQANENLDVARTLELVQEEYTSEFGVWLVSRALARLMYKPEPPTPTIAQTFGLSARELCELILDHRHRARWLAEADRQFRNAAEDARDFLDRLDDTIFEVSGRRDAAVTVAAAKLLVGLGHWDLAKGMIEQAKTNDHRPKNLALCDELLTWVDLKRNPFNGMVWADVYERLRTAFNTGCQERYQQPESLSSLVRAVLLANAAGWPVESSRCLGVIRRSRNQDGPLDTDPEFTRRLRIESIARWYASYHKPTETMAKTCLSLLREAVDHLQFLQGSYSKDDQALIHARQVVALLADTVSDDSVVADLVRRTPHYRLHAVAVAFHRNGRRNVKDAVKDAALTRLRETHGAVTFIGIWLVQNYFDSPNFLGALETTIEALEEQTGNWHITARLARDEFPRLMAEEVAARAATCLRNAAWIEDRTEQIDYVQDLMDGGMVHWLQAEGYTNHGGLFLDNDLLEQIFASELPFQTDIRTVRSQGFWVEAVSATKILDVLQDHLKIDDHSDPVHTGIGSLAKGYRLNMALNQDRRGCIHLSISGVIYPRLSTEPEVWLVLAETLNERLKTSLSRNRVGLRGFPAHTSRVNVQDGVIDIAVDAILRQPSSVAANKVSARTEWLAALLDRLYSTHLARLSGWDQTESGSTPISALHTARGRLENIRDETNKDEATRPHQALRKTTAVIFAAAEEVRKTVHWSSGRVRSNVFEVLLTIIQACRLSNVAPPESLRGIGVAMPESELRHVLQAVLENAAKVAERTSGPITVEALLHQRVQLEIIVRSPFLHHQAYPTGTRRGVESARRYVEFRGGELEQGRDEGTGAWLVTIRLPLVTELPDDIDMDVEIEGRPK